MSIGKFMTPALEEMLTTIPPPFSNILGNSILVIYTIITNKYNDHHCIQAGILRLFSVLNTISTKMCGCFF